ncbi:MAG TPA: lytic transglycosylase domain-containing protein [Chthoniobacterales bacterium]|nr:lytic transglycosylase domain-containing protein [Chthoniobacterales bacterium]
MIKFVFKLALCILLALAGCLGYIGLRSGDPLYSVYEWISPARFQQYDRLIRTAAAQQQLDPMLIKALIWRESRFDTQKHGSAGERGLMQVSERAANEWARENKIDNFHAEGLFDPQTNLRAGTWYLRRAFDHWQAQPDPLPFALAEYNAGASRVQRWVGGNEAVPLARKEFLRRIDFPATRKYVEQIIARYNFYKRRGRM